MNDRHRGMLLDALRGLESHFDKLTDSAEALPHQASCAALATKTVLLRTQLVVGTEAEVLFPLFDAYVSDYLHLLDVLQSARDEADEAGSPWCR